MSNSNLVNYTRISPNSNPRRDTIKKITIHHMAGNLSVEQCGNVFASSSRQASANYGIGSDGRVGLYVDESNRAWTSSNPANDNQAVTIEIANDVIGGDWHVSDVALNKLIDLCTDICKRNGITSLNYTGDANGNLTRHNMFKSTTCPGPYLQSKFPYIAQEINNRLNPPTPQPVNPGIVAGNRVKLLDFAWAYATGQRIPNSVKNKVYTVQQLGTTNGHTKILLKEIVSWVWIEDVQKV